MRAKMAGAVVAACVGVCALAGGAQRAEASYLGTAVRTGTSGDGDLNIDLVLYTTSHPSSFDVTQSDEDYFNPGYFIDASVHADDAYLNGFSLYRQYDNDPFDYIVNIQLKSNDAVYTYSDINGSTTDVRPFTYNISLLLNNYNGNVTGQLLAGGNILSSSYEMNLTYVGTDLFTTFVPLPSSAPLFGTALLALAGLGWSARKRSQCTIAPTGEPTVRV